MPASARSVGGSGGHMLGRMALASGRPLEAMPASPARSALGRPRVRGFCPGACAGASVRPGGRFNRRRCGLRLRFCRGRRSGRNRGGRRRAYGVCWLFVTVALALRGFGVALGSSPPQLGASLCHRHRGHRVSGYLRSEFACRQWVPNGLRPFRRWFCIGSAGAGPSPLSSVRTFFLARDRNRLRPGRRRLLHCSAGLGSSVSTAGSDVLAAAGGTVSSGGVRRLASSIGFIDNRRAAQAVLSPPPQVQAGREAGDPPRRTPSAGQSSWGLGSFLVHGSTRIQSIFVLHLVVGTLEQPRRSRRQAKQMRESVLATGSGCCSAQSAAAEASWSHSAWIRPRPRRRSIRAPPARTGIARSGRVRPRRRFPPWSGT